MNLAASSNPYWVGYIVQRLQRKSLYIRITDSYATENASGNKARLRTRGRVLVEILPMSLSRPARSRFPKNPDL